MKIKNKLLFIGGLLVALAFLAGILIIAHQWEGGRAAEAEDDARAEYTEHALIGLLLLFIVIAAIAMFRMSRSIAERIAALRRGADRIAGGNLDYRIAMERGDELGQLARALNAMAAALKQSYDDAKHAAAELAQKAAEAEQTKKGVLNLLEDLSIAQAQLQEAFKKDEAILQNVGDGMTIIDKSGNINRMNSAAREMLGLKAEKIEGASFTELIPMEDEHGNRIPQEQRPLRRTLSRGEKFTAVAAYYFVRKDKTRIPVSITVTPILLEGQVIGAVHLFRDMTREEAISRAKSEFISIAAHQLRTPLSIMRWMAEIALEKSLPLEKRKSYIRDLYDQIIRLINLVNALLDVSRSEAGQIDFNPIPTDIAKFALEIAASCKPAAKAKHVACAFTAQQPLPPVKLDSNLFRIVLSNLLLNAIDYTPAGGKVTLAIARARDAVVLSISDTGIGIPTADQPRIFERFFRAGNAGKMVASGTGLGLYLAKMLVDRWKGKIWFESAEGKGSTFFFTVPL